MSAWATLVIDTAGMCLQEKGRRSKISGAADVSRQVWAEDMRWQGVGGSDRTALEAWPDFAAATAACGLMLAIVVVAFGAVRAAAQAGDTGYISRLRGGDWQVPIRGWWTRVYGRMWVVTECVDFEASSDVVAAIAWAPGDQTGGKATPQGVEVVCTKCGGWLRTLREKRRRVIGTAEGGTRWTVDGEARLARAAGRCRCEETGAMKVGRQQVSEDSNINPAAEPDTKQVQTGDVETEPPWLPVALDTGEPEEEVMRLLRGLAWAGDSPGVAWRQVTETADMVGVQRSRLEEGVMRLQSQERISLSNGWRFVRLVAPTEGRAVVSTVDGGTAPAPGAPPSPPEETAVGRRLERRRPAATWQTVRRERSARLQIEGEYRGRSETGRARPEGRAGPVGTTLDVHTSDGGAVGTAVAGNELSRIRAGRYGRRMLWHVTHKAWNALMHAMCGNGTRNEPPPAPRHPPPPQPPHPVVASPSLSISTSPLFRSACEVV